jgi:hypothetical protein
MTGAGSNFPWTGYEKYSENLWTLNVADMRITWEEKKEKNLKTFTYLEFYEGNALIIIHCRHVLCKLRRKVCILYWLSYLLMNFKPTHFQICGYCEAYFLLPPHCFR